MDSFFLIGWLVKFKLFYLVKGDCVGVAAQSFGGTSESSYGFVESYLWGVLSCCACVLLQHSLLLRIRVEQRNQFGSASAFLLWTEEVVFF